MKKNTKLVMGELNFHEKFDEEPYEIKMLIVGDTEEKMLETFNKLIDHPKVVERYNEMNGKPC